MNTAPNATASLGLPMVYLVDDEDVRRARLALVAATAQVLRNGLGLLGVSAPRKM